MELNRIVTSNIHLVVEDEDIRLLAAILRTDLDTAADKLNGTAVWDVNDIAHLAEYYQVEPASFAVLRPKDRRAARDT